MPLFFIILILIQTYVFGSLNEGYRESIKVLSIDEIKLKNKGIVKIYYKNPVHMIFGINPIRREYTHTIDLMFSSVSERCKIEYMLDKILYEDLNTKI